MAKRLGINSLTRNDYGLSLTLGGGEVSLLDMTSAYAVIANGGVKVPPVAIAKIVDFHGNTVFEYTPPPGEQVLRPEHAFLMQSILSDSVARTPTFGSNSILNLPFQAAVKTGTSNDSRDNWTMGFTPDLAVGVWVGNPDYTPMENTTGVTGAGPVWAQMMTFGINHLTGGHPSPFVMPPGVEKWTICSASGTRPSQWCPGQREEFFASGQPPLPPEEDLWRKIQIDTWTNLEASTECTADFTDEILALNVREEWARNWIRQEPQGMEWARNMGFENVIYVPERTCTAADPRPRLQFTNLADGQTITQSSLEIHILADATGGFRSWRLEWGPDPDHLTLLVPDNATPQSASGQVYTWDLSGLPNGSVTLRLYMQGDGNTYADKHIGLNFVLPTPTPTPTSTPTSTPMPTDTSTPEPTSTPIPEPTSTPVEVDTPTPTENPTP